MISQVVTCADTHIYKSVQTSVHSETISLDDAVSRLEREITLLREYRTRLVADVVTGKLDVRAAAAALPDEAPLDAVPEENLDSPDADASLDEEEDL
jgi:type I restriction enzyme S subunit